MCIRKICCSLSVVRSVLTGNHICKSLAEGAASGGALACFGAISFPLEWSQQLPLPPSISINLKAISHLKIRYQLRYKGSHLYAHVHTYTCSLFHVPCSMFHVPWSDLSSSFVLSSQPRKRLTVALEMHSNTNFLLTRHSKQHITSPSHAMHMSWVC